MNRGFKTYYSEGIKQAFTTLTKKENFLKYYLHQFIIALGSIFGFILSPIFNLSQIRMIKAVRKRGKVEISNSFKTANSFKSFWTLLLTYLIQALMILAGVMLFVVVEVFVILAAVLFQIMFEDPEVGLVVGIILSIPVAIGLIVYLIVSPLYFSPVTYIVDSVEGAETSDVLSMSLEAMKHEGKRTVFATQLVTSLIIVGYITLATFISLLLILTEEIVGMVFGIIFATAFIIAFIIFSPVLILGANIALVSLFEDVVMDKFNKNKVASGIYLKGAKSIKQSVENYQEDLVKLFDDTEEVKLSLENKTVTNDLLKKMEEKPKVEKKIDIFNENDLKKLMEENKIEESLVEEEKVVVPEEKEEPVIEEPKEKKTSLLKKVKKSLKTMMFGEDGEEGDN